MWEFEVTEKKQTFERFDVSLDLAKGYFFERVKNNGQLTALDLEYGKRLWTTEIKLKEVPEMFAMSDGVVVVDDKFLNLYDLKKGSLKWQTKKATGIVVDLGEPGIAVAARGVRLMLLDKRTGEELGSMILGDKEPIYDYDPYSGQVFLKSDKKQIISYSF